MRYRDGLRLAFFVYTLTIGCHVIILRVHIVGFQTMRLGIGMLGVLDIESRLKRGKNNKPVETF